MARSPASTPRGEGFQVLRTRSERAAADDFEAADADCAPSPQPAAPSDSARLAAAVGGLAARHPEFSAATGLPRWQRRTLLVLVAATATGAVLAPEPTLAALLALMAVPFLMVVALRAVALWHLLAGRARPRPCACCDRRRRAAPALYGAGAALSRGRRRAAPLARARRDRLPGRPARGAADRRERRPRDAGGAARRDARSPSCASSWCPTAARAPSRAPCNTRCSSRAATTSSSTTPRTCPSPTSCAARSRRLRAAPGRLGCLQAQLNIYNSRAELADAPVHVEYTALFDGILPALERLRLPVPLGGTSNHFPRAVLDAVGGWDPYNVTEDADLGIRLARAGWHVGVLTSTTWEEAPPTFGVWLRQRTRWLKGWMQTYLVHMRQPRRLWRELGPRRFIGLQVLMGGLILSALVHPWFYVLVAADAWHGRLLGVPVSLLGQTLLWVGLFNVITGYVIAIALGSVATARRGRLGLAAARAAHAGLLARHIVRRLPRAGPARVRPLLLGEDGALRPPGEAARRLRRRSATRRGRCAGAPRNSRPRDRRHCASSAAAPSQS